MATRRDSIGFNKRYAALLPSGCAAAGSALAFRLKLRASVFQINRLLSVTAGAQLQALWGSFQAGRTTFLDPTARIAEHISAGSAPPDGSAICNR